MKFMMKFILIGNSSIGKSTLAWRYKFENFKEYFNSTIGVDVQTKSYDIFSNKIEILLWDTAGQEKFQAISSSFYRDSIAVFLCFDFTNRKSFEDIPKWMNLMIPYLPDYCHIVLVGLKNEIKNKTVSELEAKIFAKKHQMKFYSVSSKTGENIENMFIKTAESIMVDYKNNLIQLHERSGGLRVKDDKKRRYSCWPWF